MNAAKTTAAKTTSVTSRDGTRIGVRTHPGDGPGILLIQGAMGDVHDYDDLAAELSRDFRVHAVERRGRGISPREYGADHDIARDVEDIDAVLEATGSDLVFGLSSGAVITLEAARTLPRIRRAAVYEPPFYRDGIDHEGLTRLGDELTRGDLPAAMLTSLLTARTAPDLLRRMPRPLARLAAAAVLRVDDRRTHAGASMRELVPGNRFDFHSVAQMDGRMTEFASVDRPVLVLTGTRSPEFLRTAARDLLEVLPDARLADLAGLDHGSPWNAARGRNPEAVAAPLVEFFTEAGRAPRCPSSRRTA